MALGATKAEAVGELPLISGPELGPLLLGELEKLIVELLELLVLLGQVGIVVSVVGGRIVTAPAIEVAIGATPTLLVVESKWISLVVSINKKGMTRLSYIFAVTSTHCERVVRQKRNPNCASCRYFKGASRDLYRA